jgi:hypothetical protein
MPGGEPRREPREAQMSNETYDDNHPISIARSNFNYFNDQKEDLIQYSGSLKDAIQETYNNVQDTVWEKYGKELIEWDGMLVDPQDLADEEWHRLWLEQEGQEFYEKHFQ